MRYEHTTSHLNSDKQQNVVNRKYGSLFTNAFWLHSINEHNKISFSYSLRITRSRFNDLAPSMIFADPNSFITGNRVLQ
ncbi:MAG: outer membrane beta-barrel protein [Flavihumibacter sp.]